MGAFERKDDVDVPVTLAWGELDQIVGRPSRSRRPPGARYLEMPGWGHTPTWDDPRGRRRADPRVERRRPLRRRRSPLAPELLDPQARGRVRDHRSSRRSRVSARFALTTRWIAVRR